MTIVNIGSMDYSTGCANVFIDCHGDNAIIISTGANADIPDGPVAQVLAQSDPADWLLFQNEAKLPPMAIAQAKAGGLKITSCAAALQVARLGAADVIPTVAEVEAFARHSAVREATYQ
ncbi:MAG: hypothetical protein ABJP33_09040 [Pseudoruegeria sp.]